MNQFRIAYDRPAVDGKTKVIHIVDPDFNRFTLLPSDVQRLPDCEHDTCAAVLRVPNWRVRYNIVDLWTEK